MSENTDIALEIERQVRENAGILKEVMLEGNNNDAENSTEQENSGLVLPEIEKSDIK